MFRAWEEYHLGTPLYYLLQTMTDVLRSLDKELVIEYNYTIDHYICNYEVGRLLKQLENHVYK